MQREQLELTLQIEAYIANPFWPERSQVIEIDKLGGVAQQKSEPKRLLARQGQLDKMGLTMADYERLVARSNRAWYRKDPEDETSEIVIPRHHLAGMLVQAVGHAPKSVRGGFDKDSFRHVVRLSDLTTGKYTHDTVFSRYVKLETSNQRNLQTSYVITNFKATGTVELLADAKVADLERLLKFALMQIGLGSSRKMGYGRGELVSLA